MNPIFYSPLYCELTCLPFYCYSPFLPFSFYPTFINSTLATSSMSLQYFYLFSPKPLIFFPSFHCISPFHSQTSGFVSIRISSIKRSISYPVSCSLPYLIMASWFVHWTSFSFSFGYYDLVNYPGSISLIIGNNIFVHISLCWGCYFSCPYQYLRCMTRSLTASKWDYMTRNLVSFPLLFTSFLSSC